jgi:hypothetical protein
MIIDGTPGFISAELLQDLLTGCTISSKRVGIVSEGGSWKYLL